MNLTTEIINRAHLKPPPRGAKGAFPYTSIVMTRTRHIRSYDIISRKTHAYMSVSVFRNKEGKRELLGIRPASSKHELDSLFEETCKIVTDVITEYYQWLHEQQKGE